MPTDDLITFLRARLEEDEQVAREAIAAHEPAVARFLASRPDDMEPMDGETAADWHGGTNEDGDGNFWCGVWAGDGIASILRMDDEHDTRTAEHIARHDPARVLADVEAKRAIVDRTETELGDGTSGETVAIHVMLLLALPYRDHPDYRPEWSPEQALRWS